MAIDQPARPVIRTRWRGLRGLLAAVLAYNAATAFLIVLGGFVGSAELALMLLVAIFVGFRSAFPADPAAPHTRWRGVRGLLAGVLTFDVGGAALAMAGTGQVELAVLGVIALVVGFRAAFPVDRTDHGRSAH